MPCLADDAHLSETGAPIATHLAPSKRNQRRGRVGQIVVGRRSDADSLTEHSDRRRNKGDRLLENVVPREIIAAFLSGAYSAFTLRSLTISRHDGISAAMMADSSAGVLDAASKP
jgi:hypothetical protein